MRTCRLYMLLSLCLALVLWSGQARAAPANHLALLTVELWPEYDRPAMLVMLEAELPASVSLPAVVHVKIPAAVGKPHAVAKRGKDRKLYDAKSTRTVEGAWATIAITTDRPIFRLEYYAPLDTKKPRRTFHFEWPGAPKIDKVQLSAQVPAGVTTLKIVPEAKKLWKDRRGLTYYRQTWPNHPAGKALVLDISYTKKDAALTAASLQKRRPGPAVARRPASVASARVPQKKHDRFPSFVITAFLLVAGVGLAIAMRRPKTKAVDRAAQTRGESKPSKPAPRDDPAPKPKASQHKAHGKKRRGKKR